MKPIVVLAGIATVSLALMVWALAGIRADWQRARSDGAPARQEGAYRGSEPPATIRLPRFVLRDHRGDRVASHELEQGVLVLTFLDSQCEDACPGIAAVIGRTLDRLPPGERRGVRAVAISTDPAEDTAASVQDFLARNRALGRLAYLTAPPDALRRAWRDFRILASEESRVDSVHSAPVRIYRDGIWVATQHAGIDLSPANLRHDIRVALGTSR